ncbi:hypothetical protein [Bradyrhizobium sp. CCBAU 51753]|uniref:hypothetical protein n=1 Tax=Bradyrhizobium sp. CCBAU 51753 TaxID=1325100 RepID=UPI00188A318F|nr:hypothetical protein [Bradyrhizobium sp. CCBAU 51753]QOZ23944.1 hypothetical protein XH93_10270 [Bradyrhizobium sp. CCBAU 51753]
MSRDDRFANGRTLSILLDRILLALSAVTTTVLFGWLLYYSSYGFFLTDEGMWLNSIANPFAYAMDIPPTLFRFVYHWPYEWADGDIAVLRVANITLTMMLSWTLSFLVVQRFWTMGWLHVVILSAGIASLGLAAFQGWFPLTPNYYTLNLQSVLIVMIGLLFADRPGSMRQVLGGILVGFGGWCCFMARPASAAAIALVVLLYVVVLRRKSLLHMHSAVLVALALLIVTVYLIGGGITGLVTRMVNGAEGITMLGAGHKLSRIFHIEWLATSSSELAIAVLLATALPLSILIGSTYKLLLVLALATVLFLTMAIALLGIDPISIKFSTLFLVPAFICLGAMFYRKGMILRSQARTSITLALTFFVVPTLLTLSSMANYWWNCSLAALFWMLAVVALLSPLVQQGRSVATLLPLTVLAQLLTASVINTGMLKPFRQVRDLRAYTAVTPLPRGGKLVLSQSFHDYLTTAIAQARSAGLEVGTPAIDLTGISPNLLYVLETRALGLPWQLGGYPGSNAVAAVTLGHENCADLAKAWLLVEPEGPYRLDQASVMASFGAGQADYVEAATLDPPIIDGFPRPARQYLFKPVRPVALAERTCREARRQVDG